MMLLFQWNALRVGDHVLVHDDLDPDLELRDGVVTLVDTRRGGANDVGIRIGATGAVQRPRRHAVHLTPLDERYSCWRCDSVARGGMPAGGDAVAA
jgi:hypothetical protein